jgi:hypothetical protein
LPILDTSWQRSRSGWADEWGSSFDFPSMSYRGS